MLPSSRSPGSRLHRVMVVPSPDHVTQHSLSPTSTKGLASGASTSGGSSPVWRRPATQQSPNRSPSPYGVPDWTRLYQATGLTPKFLGRSPTSGTPASALPRMGGELGQSEVWEEGRRPSTRSVSCPPEVIEYSGRHLGDTATTPSSRTVTWEMDQTPVVTIGSPSLSSPGTHRSVEDFTRSVIGPPSAVTYLTASTAFNAPPKTRGARWRSEQSRIGPQPDALFGEAAIRYLDEVGRGRLSPAKPHWEQDEARNRMIDQQKRTLIKGDRPGSSWQIQPGTVPPSRALPVSPDRVGGTEYINQRRRKMLQDIRKKLNSSGADKYLVLMGAMWDADPEQSGTVRAADFFTTLRRFAIQVDAESETMLVDLFALPGQPSADTRMDYNKFTAVLFAASSDLTAARPAHHGAGLSAQVMNRSSIDWGMRPRSKEGSGCIESAKDWRKIGDMPLVVPSGSTKTKGSELFLSERELVLRKSHCCAPPSDTVEALIEARALQDKQAERQGFSNVFVFQEDPEQYTTVYRVDFQKGKSVASPPQAAPAAKPTNQYDYWAGPKLSRRPTAHQMAAGQTSVGGIGSKDWVTSDPWWTALSELGKAAPPAGGDSGKHTEITWEPSREGELNRSELFSDASGEGVSAWSSTNLCNKDLPERAPPAKLDEEHDPRLRPVWTFQRPDCDYMPHDWQTTSRGQQLFKPRQRTPSKVPKGHKGLRIAPWSVRERHMVHLQKYDHKLVGLRRPEKLAHD